MLVTPLESLGSSQSILQRKGDIQMNHFCCCRTSDEFALSPSHHHTEAKFVSASLISQHSQGLGNLGKPFDISLQPSVKPYALFPPRSIPIPLWQKVRQEHNRMLLLGVISKVDIPSPLCICMVVAPKYNGGYPYMCLLIAVF